MQFSTTIRELHTPLGDGASRDLTATAEPLVASLPKNANYSEYSTRFSVITGLCKFLFSVSFA